MEQKHVGETVQDGPHTDISADLDIRNVGEARTYRLLLCFLLVPLLPPLHRLMHLDMHTPSSLRNEELKK